MGRALTCSVTYIISFSDSHLTLWLLRILLVFCIRIRGQNSLLKKSGHVPSVAFSVTESQHSPAVFGFYRISFMVLVASSVMCLCHIVYPRPNHVV